MAKKPVNIPKEQLARIDGLLRDVDQAAKALPATERREHEDSERSIAAARRHAKLHDGSFRIF